MADREIPVEQVGCGSILELADPKTLARSAARGDALGSLFRRVQAAADPDLEFQAVVRKTFVGCNRVQRRQLIEKMRLAFGIVRIPDDLEHRFRANVNTDSGNLNSDSGDVEHGFRDVEHRFRRT